MTIKPDSWIIEQCQNNAMINPFSPTQVTSDSEGNPIISYGVSSYGYDITCAPEFKIFTNLKSTVIDPKNFNTDNFVTHVGNECIIPPNSFILTRTREYFKIPRDVIAVCYGKSTYARTGISIECTVMEPEFEGHIVLEFANNTPLPAKIYANEGVAQLIFYQSDTTCKVSYSDRKGKYMGQTGVTLPRLKK